MATALIRAGQFTQTDWATALGKALSDAADKGAPDSEDTYFQAALSALETLTEQAGISGQDRQARKADWEEAYRRTPHGKPVQV